MKYFDKLHIIPLLIFIILGIGISLSNCSHGNNPLITSKEVFDDYMSSVDYRLEGKVVSKVLLKRNSSEWQNLYLVEVQIYSFDIRKNNLASDSPFFGVYDTIANKAYFISQMHDPLYRHKDFPHISVDTEYGRILGSNGLQVGLNISRAEDCDMWKVLLDKENSNTIRF